MSLFDDPFGDGPSEDEGFDFGAWYESNELEVEENDEEMCDHDEHKEVVPAQEIRGANAMGIGGQYGTTEVLIVCKKCGKSKPADRVDEARDQHGHY
jgi:hypothetical protein